MLLIIAAGVIVSAGIAYGGSWLADDISTGESTEESELPRDSYMPAPVPGRFEPEAPRDEEDD